MDDESEITTLLDGDRCCAVDQDGYGFAATNHLVTHTITPNTPSYPRDMRITSTRIGDRIVHLVPFDYPVRLSGFIEASEEAIATEKWKRRKISAKERGRIQEIYDAVDFTTNPHLLEAIKEYAAVVRAADEHTAEHNSMRFEDHWESPGQARKRREDAWQKTFLAKPAVTTFRNGDRYYVVDREDCGFAAEGNLITHGVVRELADGMSNEFEIESVPIRDRIFQLIRLERPIPLSDFIPLSRKLAKLSDAYGGEIPPDMFSEFLKEYRVENVADNPIVIDAFEAYAKELKADAETRADGHSMRFEDYAPVSEMPVATATGDNGDIVPDQPADAANANRAGGRVVIQFADRAAHVPSKRTDR